MSTTDRTDAAREWDARAEQAVGVLIRRYLHEHPPPHASRIADDLEDWSDRLIADGDARLRAAGRRALVDADATWDAQSAERITTALRREQQNRDGRPLARTWAHLARRIEQDYPQA